MRYNVLLRPGRWLLLPVLALFAFSCASPPAAAPTASAPASAKAGSAAATDAPPGESISVGTKDLSATLAVSRPANGTHFVAGEQPVLTLTLQPASGKTIDRAQEFSQLRLLASGPMSMVDTVTAVKLLKTTADRADALHHAVDLVANPEVQVSGNVLTYKLGAVSDEKPGTYTAAVRGASKIDPMQQIVATINFQVGTATVEKQAVSQEKCAACHLGSDSGKFYFAHIDPGQPGQPGSWAMDQAAITLCKTCHNNDGYAAYRSPADTNVRIPDPIVKRVHGVHMGEELQNPENIDHKTGVFKAYVGVIFPQKPQNCEACHVDTRWKTQPSAQACGSCHDTMWFGNDASKTPKGYTFHEEATHAPCAQCHPADPNPSGQKSISEVHVVKQPMDAVDITMTPPANGKFYVAGEKPKVTIVIKDDAGKPIDHTAVDTANFSTAALFVYGNRANAVPVLTSAAKNGASKAYASVGNQIAAPGDATKGWTFAEGDTFKIAVNGNPAMELAAPVGLQTPNQVRDWLMSSLSGQGVTVTATATNVTIRSAVQGEKSRIEIYNSPVTTKMGWKPLPKKMASGLMTKGVTMEPYVLVGQASTQPNDLRKLTDPMAFVDPNVTRTAANITYQLDDVKGLSSGTYAIYMYTLPVAKKNPNVTRTAIGFTTFQVGTETAEPKIATNCTNCHGNTIWHLDAGPIHAEPFDTDYCNACHDKGRLGTGESFAPIGGTSVSGWSGYGAMPISRRVHAVHFGRYLKYPEGVYAGNPDMFAEAIFPQDVRNCTKCHDSKTASAAWKENPSRMVCMGCHDTDAANAHAVLQTQNRTTDPFSGENIETCAVCHGAGKDLAADKVHNIKDPYKPPYVREPANRPR